MSAIAEQLKPMLAALTTEDRREVMAYLAGLNGDGELAEEEWEDAWADEINRRVADSKAGNVRLIPAEEVFRELDEKLK